MYKIILTENPFEFNLELLLKQFYMSFVYKLHVNMCALCNGRGSGCCQTELDSFTSSDVRGNCNALENQPIWVADSM